MQGVLSIRFKLTYESAQIKLLASMRLSHSKVLPNLKFRVCSQVLLNYENTNSENIFNPLWKGFFDQTFIKKPITELTTRISNNTIKVVQLLQYVYQSSAKKINCLTTNSIDQKHFAIFLVSVTSHLLSKKWKLGV